MSRKDLYNQWQLFRLFLADYWAVVFIVVAVLTVSLAGFIFFGDNLLGTE